VQPNRRPVENPVSEPTFTYAGTHGSTRELDRYNQWLERTYAPGTPVMLTEDWSTESFMDLPKGTKGKVVAVREDRYRWPKMVEVEFYPSFQVHEGAGAFFRYRVLHAGSKYPVEGHDVTVLKPLVDHWASAPRSMGRHNLPRSQRSPLKPNLQPSVRPPGRVVGGGSKWRTWVERTYAAGTPVKLAYESSAVILAQPSAGELPNTRLPKGTRGEVVGLPHWDAEAQGWVVTFEVSDARDASGMRLPVVGRQVRAFSGLLEPLVDNWKSGRRTSRGRHNLPRSQRSPLKPNIALDSLTVPPPSGGRAKRGARHAWAQKTFATGTPVKLLNYWAPSKGGPIVPPGARGVVVGTPFGSSGPIGGGADRHAVSADGVPLARGPGLYVMVEIVDARDSSGSVVPGAIGMTVTEPYGSLEPMVDNWKSGRRTSRGRHNLPRSQRSPLKPNPIPPPPQDPRNQWNWFLRTFPVGTSITWKKDQAWAPGGGINMTLPRGIKAEIISHDPVQYGGDPDDQWIVARFLKVIPGVSSSEVEAFAADLEQRTGQPLHDLDFGLEPKDAVSGTVWPMTDTWGATPGAGRRHALPRSQRSWLKPNSDEE
jgi:hypothetical protein